MIDGNGETRSDLKTPDQLSPEPPGASELSQKIRDMLAEEKEFYVIVQSAIGHEQVMDIKMMTTTIPETAIAMQNTEDAVGCHCKS